MTIVIKRFNGGGTRRGSYMKITGFWVWVWGGGGVGATSGSQTGRKVSSKEMMVMYTQIF